MEPGQRWMTRLDECGRPAPGSTVAIEETDLSEPVEISLFGDDMPYDLAIWSQSSHVEE